MACRRLRIFPQKQPGSTARSFIRDLHGDVVGLYQSSNGSAKATKTYTPWGEARTSSGETASLGFQGDPTDTETGLVDMLSRYYVPSLGRFTTRDVLFGDPLNPVSLNQFAYAVGNPVTLSDPTGMCPVDRDCPPPASFTEKQKQQWYSYQGSHPQLYYPTPVPPAPPTSLIIDRLMDKVFNEDLSFEARQAAADQLTQWPDESVQNQIYEILGDREAGEELAGQATWHTWGNVLGGAFDRRHQIMTGVQGVSCTAGLVVPGLCAAVSGGVAAEKEAESFVRWRRGDTSAGRFVADTAWNAANVIPGGNGVRGALGAGSLACSFSKECSGPGMPDTVYRLIKSMLTPPDNPGGCSLHDQQTGWASGYSPGCS